MYENMTDTELAAELQRITEERTALKAKALEVQKVLDARAVQAEMEKALGNLSEGAKAALAQRLGVPSIPTGEVFGVPGRG